MLSLWPCEFTGSLVFYCTVTMHNIDHTVTGFGIDLTVPPGQTISHTFDQLGTFDYRCTIHPGMTGTVIVS